MAEAVAAAGVAVAAVAAVAEPTPAAIACWTEDQRALWDRLRAFDIDAEGSVSTADASAPADPSELAGAPPSLPFRARLARENGWRAGYAARVVEEYRRFLFLAAVSGHPVTPSEAVDQAWHLHLCYTRAYWDGLCGDVLGFRLHHGPTRGGRAEAARYDAQYRATLSSYANCFGALPPAEIWPPAERRFGRDLRWRRVWSADAWVLPKRRLLLVLALGVAMGLVGAFAR